MTKRKPAGAPNLQRMTERLERLEAGMPIVFAGDRVVRVSEGLAAGFRQGDRLLVVGDTGDLLHIPAGVWATATAAVETAYQAFSQMGVITDDQITAFYEELADRLAHPSTFAPIAEANASDIERARERGRSVTRLVLDEKMRVGMIEGLRAWAAMPPTRGQIIEEIHHVGWSVAQIKAGLGVVGFVFEGRPNVFADATGVLRSGNTVVFRIGSDALGTARAIVQAALDPALEAAGLPHGAVTLVDSPSRAAGWAMFSDPRLALAVARGSGKAVTQLGAVARQAGIPVSLHGTGGAWIIAAPTADPKAFASAIHNSLDRKVCNTLNTCCIVTERAEDLIPVFLDSLQKAADRRAVNPKLHVVEGQQGRIPTDWFTPVPIVRAGGAVTEPRTETIGLADLGVEWEWEESPEVSLAVVESVDHAVELFNRLSPRFVASLVSEDTEEHHRFFEMIDSPFVGNGFTRWVDGQYALNRPELGLSNWQFGRLFGRGGVLSGDGVFTVRTKATQTDPEIGR